MTSECAWKCVYVCTQICASNVMRVSFPDCTLEFVLILRLNICELFKLFDRSNCIVKHIVEILLSRPNDQNMSIKMKIIHVAPCACKTFGMHKYTVATRRAFMLIYEDTDIICERDLK